MRIDPTGSHDYAATAAMPAAAPVFPWAIYLTGTDHRFRLLAFDFDSSRHGADVARTDADRLCGHLDELGVDHLRTVSGPTGGQHVWVRLDTSGAAATDVARLARVLRRHYPSLDTAPLSNPVTGAVRPPGAPHRRGGHSLPHLDGRALEAVLARMETGTHPAVVDWLLARHPHTAEPSRDDRGRTVRIVDDPACGPHLDRPRRPLTARTRALLAGPPATGVDRSALAHSILLGMARAGHTLADVEAAAATAPGLVRLRDDSARGRDDTERQWQRALVAAAEFAPAPNTERAPIDDELDRIEAAITADPTYWARPGGASDERILHALLVLARTARTRRLDIDVRRLAEAAAVDASTASRRLRALAADGWVTRIADGAGTRAATWELTLPDTPDTAATQGEPAPRPPGSSPALLDHHTHDVWANGAGLGAAAARIHWALLTRFWESPNSASHRIDENYLEDATGYGRATIRKTLRRLRELRLLPSRTRAPRLARAAAVIGSAGTAARRARRHLVDRELHRWWTEEIEWRRRPGKKRGVPAGIQAGAIALPLAAPARARYGRFPTVDGGRADYPAARARVVAALETPALPEQSAA
ncbi:helix-turn-helix domain-containing protein [Prescottella subtropica]|uniref:helix-turn-helix domain-containing protein n=1 Tax=Prescottella subtropica TaxID=2545757 RepID=UPI0010F8FEEA|nr:helix-turn-helix domain-containing protein [Prescottella subtropica]